MGLFRRIEAVYRSLPASNLEPDQIRLVTRLYEHFVRRGAQLNTAEKARLSEINQELAARFAEFRAKVLADENTWTVLDRESDLAGLPASVIAAARTSAEERGLAGSWAIVNTRSSVDPFLTFSPRRDLREVVWKKFKSRGDNGDANDTKATISGHCAAARRARQAARIQQPRALAHAGHDGGGSSKRHRASCCEVWPAVVARVRHEVADMQELANREQSGTRHRALGLSCTSPRKCARRNTISTKPRSSRTCELDNMVAAALWSAERRFGLAFREITGTVPVFHPDVRVWDVSRHEHRTASRRVLSGQFRAGREEIWRLGNELPDRSMRWTSRSPASRRTTTTS